MGECVLVVLAVMTGGGRAIGLVTPVAVAAPPPPPPPPPAAARDPGTAGNNDPNDPVNGLTCEAALEPTRDDVVLWWSPPPPRDSNPLREASKSNPPVPMDAREFNPDRDACKCPRDGGGLP